MKLDLLIRNGTVMDPAADTVEVMDIGVKARKIVRLDAASPTPEALHEIDASDCVVTPGLIDCHCHLFAGSGDSGMRADFAFLPGGVTAGVDAGSAGFLNYPLFSSTVVKSSLCTIKAMLHVSPGGLVMSRHAHEVLSPDVFDAPRAADCIARHPGEIAALKVRMSKEIVGERGLGVLENALRLADAVGLPLEVHTTNPPCPVGDILGLLRSGDIYTHTYQGTGHSIAAPDGSPQACARRARERGVLFDVADGISHFSSEIARRAIAEGFLPDLMGSDEIARSMYLKPVHSLPYIMSKYLAVGMKLPDILRAVTAAPARVFGFDGLGTLADGAAADLAVFRVKDCAMRFRDTQGREFAGEQAVIPQLTVKNGVVFYRQVDF